MKLTFGFSPCPNDTFMFDAIYNKRIDLEGLDITCIMEDVEYLNKAAFKNKFDITKISFNAFTKLTEGYQLLHSGSALGRNCGPLLISKQPPGEIDVSQALIAIPGLNTTAHFLLSYAYPGATNKRESLFSEIEDLVSSGAVDLGLIIHENRFTYRDKGLHKVLDLGEYWEQETGLPIPLGGIAVKRNLPEDIKSKVNRIVTNSVAYAFAHRSASESFVKTHAQEMSSEVIAAHIDLYVNDFSLNINNEGKAAVYNLFKVINKGAFDKNGIFL